MKKVLMMAIVFGLCLTALSVPALQSEAEASAPVITLFPADRPGWESAVGTYEEECFTDATLNPGVSVVSEYPGYVDTTKGVWWDRLVCPAYGMTTTTWHFSTPISGFGGNWDPGVPGGPGANIALAINGAWVSVGEIPNNYTGQFWGFFSSEPFHAVRLSPGSLCGYAWCETYELDNMVYAFRGKFKKGDIVRATVNNLKVRDDEHKEIDEVHAGYCGEILGPHRVAEVGGVDYTFWKIEWRWRISEDHRNGRVPLVEKITGWSAENWLLKNDVYWLAKMIINEASVGEELEQIAVGWTVLHRLDPRFRGRFGSDLEEVVLDGYGPHWVNIREPTDADIVRLAERLLRSEEPDPTNGATHFFSPRSQEPPHGRYPVPGTSDVAYYACWAGPIVGWEIITITDPITGEVEEAERIVVVDPSGERETTDTRRYVTDRWHILAENTIRYYTPLADFSATEFEWTPLEGIRNWFFMFYRFDRQRISALVESPVELRVYDSEGRVSGLVNGAMVNEIPGSECFNNTVIVHYPVESYGFEVVGADEGSYRLTITTVAESGNTAFTAIDIPTSVNAVHQYTIDWIALFLGEDGVTVMVDSDGDGVFERSFTTGSVLTSDEFILKTETIVTVDPETLNLQARSRWITAYIELPDDYAAEDIDIGTVQLLYNDNQTGADWGDVQNGVLMVKFDWATVAGWFEGLHDEVVELTLAGEVNGIQFEGTDAIRIIDPRGQGEEGEV